MRARLAAQRRGLVPKKQRYTATQHSVAIRLLKKELKTATKPANRQCGRLRGLERKVDRATRKAIDKSFVKGWISLSERDTMLEVVTDLIGLYQSARALLAC